MAYLVEGDGSLDGRLVLHGLETFGPLLNLEGLVDDAIDSDLSGVKVVNSGRELVGFTETSDDGNFVAD